MTETKIDTEHPVMLAFEAVGYRPIDLKDPSEVTEGDIRDGGWRALHWNSHGLEMFDVGEEQLHTEQDWAPSGVAVKVGDGKQPIDFDEVLYDEIRPMKHLRAAADPHVTLFAPPEAERSFDRIDTQRAAADALSMWGHRGNVPKEAAEQMLSPFGADMPVTSDDPDVEGGEMVKATFVATAMLSAAGLSIEEPDGEGHDKRDRHEFYESLGALKEHLGIEDSD